METKVKTRRRQERDRRETRGRQDELRNRTRGAHRRDIRETTG